MDKQQEELKGILRQIERRTGYKFPLNLFVIKETEHMKRHWTVDGGYNWLEGLIYLRPSLFVPFIVTKETIEESKKQLQNTTFTDRPISDKEALHFIKYKEKNRRQQLKRVVAHECGHYLHDICFQGKALRIPLEGSAHKKYARKNAKENFAVLFEEYVLQEIEQDTKRYQFMDNLLNKISPIRFIQTY